jgi:hypothetical protein
VCYAPVAVTQPAAHQHITGIHGHYLDSSMTFTPVSAHIYISHCVTPAAAAAARSGACGSIEAVATGSAAAGAGDGSSSSGWRLMACHNAPEFRDATPKDKISLGEGRG